MDTYKIGTVANSTSTMHKLASTPITKDCFEMDDFNNIKIHNNKFYDSDQCIDHMWNNIINYCEVLRQEYNKTKDIKYWKELIRILPEGWLQTRAWSANYAVLRQIYYWRKAHKLSEWRQFCKWVESLPYAKELILFN